MKIKIITIFILHLFFFNSLFLFAVQAKEPVINIYFVTKETINKTMNFTLNQSANDLLYGIILDDGYIDFHHFTKKINKKISFINSLATTAKKKAEENKNQIDIQNQSILLLTDTSIEMNEKMYFLNNEMISYDNLSQERYRDLSNSTNATFQEYRNTIQKQGKEINNLKTRISNLIIALYVVFFSGICIFLILIIYRINAKYRFLNPMNIRKKSDKISIKIPASKKLSILKIILPHAFIKKNRKKLNIINLKIKK